MSCHLCWFARLCRIESRQAVYAVVPSKTRNIHRRTEDQADISRLEKHATDIRLSTLLKPELSSWQDHQVLRC
jgi:hypothetical protein